jgi:hypothetical protein
MATAMIALSATAHVVRRLVGENMRGSYRSNFMAAMFRLTGVPGLMCRVGWMLGAAVGIAAEPDSANLGALPEVPFDRLQDQALMPLGKAALELHAAEWKHAETLHFVHHFFHGFIAAPVSVEAEFYYRIVTTELQKDTAQWERKCHIFIFETQQDWAAFQTRGSLDPWTGGLHASGELFIQRNPENKFKGRSLGHEIAHLVIFRFFGNGVPLWLNEGYAEYSSERGYAAFNRARGYLANPLARGLDPSQFIPLARLTSAVSYPSQVPEVTAFYSESERLVRFLSSVDKAGFLTLFESLAHGNRLESALSKGFGTRFSNLDALERDFKAYLAKGYESSSSK